MFDRLETERRALAWRKDELRRDYWRRKAWKFIEKDFGHVENCRKG